MRYCTMLLAAAAAIGLAVGGPGQAKAANCSDAPDLLEDIQKRGSIRIGWINSKPNQFKNEKGELEGVLVNAAKVLTDDLLKVKAEWVEAKWDTFIAGMQAGKYDVVISNVARRPNRAVSV